MCRYCDSNILDALAINSKDEAVIINQDTETGEYFIDGLDERVYINYCPMCRKEAVMNIDDYKPVNNVIRYTVVFYEEPSKKDENVVDADFEEVKDDKK